MIERYEIIPSEYTDDHLFAELAKSPGQKDRAEMLLTAPPPVPAGHRDPWAPADDHDPMGSVIHRHDDGRQ